MSTKEVNEGRQKAVQIDRERGEILVLKSGEEGPKRFTFDSVYGDTALQKDIFDETAYPIINSVLEGYNGTIFAYGQTGTGKTHTMVGILGDDKEKGIIPRAFECIFMMIKSDTSQQYLV